MKFRDAPSYCPYSLVKGRFVSETPSMIMNHEVCFTDKIDLGIANQIRLKYTVAFKVHGKVRLYRMAINTNELWRHLTPLKTTPSGLQHDHSLV
jgi:hypothetical protein